MSTEDQNNKTRLHQFTFENFKPKDWKLENNFLTLIWTGKSSVSSREKHEDVIAGHFNQEGLQKTSIEDIKLFVRSSFTTKTSFLMASFEFHGRERFEDESYSYYVLQLIQEKDNYSGLVRQLISIRMVKKRHVRHRNITVFGEKKPVVN
ncbi:hypothetical protein RF11_00081 [Thelohanellus kitauei]|uniref:Uncharacterized protein n=1 Tax=Thelohanellus kitauei TaxID=669202 RepID=A0A0C2JX01_THEKT|nr:hypothetical protein RF11_00081 [Thelohanellus kitauei]